MKEKKIKPCQHIKRAIKSLSQNDITVKIAHSSHIIWKVDNRIVRDEHLSAPRLYLVCEKCGIGACMGEPTDSNSNYPL